MLDLGVGGEDSIFYTASQTKREDEVNFRAQKKSRNSDSFLYISSTFDSANHYTLNKELLYEGVNNDHGDCCNHDGSVYDCILVEC